MAIERALFVDRDGVLNEPVFRVRDGNRYQSSPREWGELVFNNSLNELTQIKALGYRLILITNQPDIERGLLSWGFLDELHAEMQDRFGLDAIYCCPYASGKHPWKKPNPGLFLKAAVEFGIRLKESFHLGDSENDTHGAKNAGCKSIVWDQKYNKSLKSDYRVANFEELQRVLTRSNSAHRVSAELNAIR